MRIQLVDENDNPVRVVGRGESGPNDIHRVSALWLTNSKGEALMARRSLSKSKDPGCWGPAVAGTIEEGETYQENIVKEIREELGISIPAEELKLGPKVRIDNKTDGYWLQWFTAVRDIPLEAMTPQPEEVIELKWYAPQELKQEVAEHPERFTRNTPRWLPSFLP